MSDSNSGTITLTDTTDGADIAFVDVTADSFVAAAQGYDIFFFGNATFTNAVTFQNTGTLLLGDATSDTFTFNGGVTENTTGTVTIDGAIVSSNDAISFGNINLGQNLSMTSAGGAISIGTITAASGSRDISITSSGGSANTVAVGAIGGNGRINTVAITSGTLTTLNGNITTDNNSGNSVTLVGTTTNGANITIDTDNNSNDGAINIAAFSGSNNNLVLNSGTAEITLSGAAFNLGSGSLTTTGDINLANNVSITATGGMTINDKIDADNASSNNRTLTLNSGTGATMTFNNAIGSAQPLAGLTITQSDGATFNSCLLYTSPSPRD